MALAQLSGRCELRDVVAGLGAQPARLYHLGIDRVARFSLSRVNAEQPHGLCKELFGRLLSRCQGGAPGTASSLGTSYSLWAPPPLTDDSDCKSIAPPCGDAAAA